MSVINKMLRDLDARNPSSSASALPPAVPLSGVAAKPLPPGSLGQGSGSIASRSLVAVLLVAAFGGAAWWWSRAGSPSVSERVASPAPLSPVAQTPTAEVATSAPAQVAKPPTQVVVAANVSSPSKAVAQGPKVQAAVKPALQKGKAVEREAAKAAAPQVVASTAPISPSPVATSITPAAGSDATAPARQQQCAREALAQAQALWGAGSRDAAIDLLQQALGLMERSGGVAANTTQFAALARELGRMLVAEGRPAAALDTLVRLEPQLAKEADIWALRGNAAQRLGRHQESVQAYTMALQLRPNEQRWMLATAVSLAALGQLSNAGDMATKASALGPISKEVQAYLRQAGVRWGEP